MKIAWQDQAFSFEPQRPSYLMECHTMFWVDGGPQRSNLSVMQPNELWHSSLACVDRSWQRERMATTDAKSVVKMASMKRLPKKRTWKPLWGSSCSGAAVGRPKQIKPMTEHCARPLSSSHTLAFHTSLRARHAPAKQQPERTRHDASCGTCTPPAMRTLLKLNRSRLRRWLRPFPSRCLALGHLWRPREVQ